MISCLINQVSVEPDNHVWDALENNKKLSNCNFQIVKGFISNNKFRMYLWFNI